ncbi:type IV pilus modification protein PilV [Allochromatium palmeri]|uniref:Type IV pilus modification protein PilV n=2 Tax=Allochromatium palmeri TaxID=231048 RepID=A0A6N8EL56_9GAMM|nr:type IV pilus modification protein PilV [Allochromatium palmeri]
MNIASHLQRQNLIGRAKPHFALALKQCGVTLIEVLITVIVLAIGLLGFAALQMTSLQSSYSSYLRMQASWLAYDLTDRMRASRSETLNGNYDDDSTGDRADWDNQVITMLGADATGSVTRNNAEVVITITWSDSRGNIKGSDGATDANDQSDDDQFFEYRTEI